MPALRRCGWPRRSWVLRSWGFAVLLPPRLHPFLPLGLNLLQGRLLLVRKDGAYFVEGARVDPSELGALLLARHRGILSECRQLLVLVFKNGFDLRLLIVGQLEFVAEPRQLLPGSAAPRSFVPIPVLAGLR